MTLWNAVMLSVQRHPKLNCYSTLCICFQVKFSASARPLSLNFKKHRLCQRFTAYVGEYYESDISLKGEKADRFTD